MGTLTAMQSTLWYSIFGYRLGLWLPHLTQEWYKHFDLDDDQSVTTIALRYDILKDSALKFEYGLIKTNKGQGLFTNVPTKSNVTLWRVALDVVF